MASTPPRSTPAPRPRRRPPNRCPAHCCYCGWQAASPHSAARRSAPGSCGGVATGLLRCARRALVIALVTEVAPLVTVRPSAHGRGRWCADRATKGPRRSAHVAEEWYFSAARPPARLAERRPAADAEAVPSPAAAAVVAAAAAAVEKVSSDAEVPPTGKGDCASSTTAATAALASKENQENRRQTASGGNNSLKVEALRARLAAARLKLDPHGKLPELSVAPLSTRARPSQSVEQLRERLARIKTKLAEGSH
mmetsp:Transcript_5864/g.17963  ORF Transcript_5864/g.17963 Transcript_5864/m.17963 type:complete len:253 (+) Transcript_5864:1752-2510(+)